jgi:hypothetical protein
MKERLEVRNRLEGSQTESVGLRDGGVVAYLLKSLLTGITKIYRLQIVTDKAVFQRRSTQESDEAGRRNLCGSYYG